MTIPSQVQRIGRLQKGKGSSVEKTIYRGWPQTGRSVEPCPNKAKGPTLHQFVTNRSVVEPPSPIVKPIPSFGRDNMRSDYYTNVEASQSPGPRIYSYTVVDADFV